MARGLLEYDAASIRVDGRNRVLEMSGRDGPSDCQVTPESQANRLDG